MIHAVTVSSFHEDSRRAGREVADELLDQLGASPDVVLLFVAAHHAYDQVLAGVYQRLSARVALIGASTAGEINSEEAASGTVTAMGLRLDGFGFETFRLDPPEGSPREAAREMGARMMKSAAPNLVLVIPDGRSAARPDEIVGGLHDVLGDVPMIGGGAADEGTFDRVATFHGRDVIRGGTVALALQGDVRIASAARTGWSTMGAPHVCNRVEQGVLVREIDNRPALDVYMESLGVTTWDDSISTFEFPLGITSDSLATPGHYDREPLLRTVMTVDIPKKTLVLAGKMEEGTRVRLTRATKDTVLEAASIAASTAASTLPNSTIALCFNCITRKILLGPRYKEEVAQAFAHLDRRIPRAGFYCYGEISPALGSAMYLQETFTLALLQG